MPTQVNLGHVVGPTGPTGPTGPAPIKGTDYWTEEEQSAIVEEAAQEAAAVVNGNVPKRTVTDLVAHGEDAYAQKPIETRIKGKTWVNRWPVINTVEKGVTVATADDGLITLSGQNTASDNSFPFASIEGIAAGKQYTLMISNSTGMTLETFYVYAQAHGSDGGYLNSYTLATATTITLPEKTTSLRCGFIIKSGQSVSWTGHIMLVDGTEAPDCFTPCASIASVETGNLVTAGKNLATETEFSLSPAQHSARIKTVSGELIPGVYFLKCVDATGGAGLKASLVDADGDTYKYLVGDPSDGIEVQVTRAGLLLNVYMDYDAGDAAAYEVRDLQLELGSTATSYEPPTVTETALPEVELRSLPNGTCDELVIKADGTCEVERNVTEYEVQGTEVINVGEHSNGQKYGVVASIASSSSSSSSLMSDRYSCGNFNTIDKYAYVPNAQDLVINDSRFTDVDTAKSILASEKPKFVFEVVQTDEPQSPVTLPTLPAPTFNQYHDSPVPSDTSVEYARDINIVLSNLEAVQTALLGGE